MAKNLPSRAGLLASVAIAGVVCTSTHALGEKLISIQVQPGQTTRVEINLPPGPS
jgi:hypothetical protein